MALIFDLDDTLFDHALAMERFLRGDYELTEQEVAAVLASAKRGKAPPDVLCRAIAAYVPRAPEVIWDEVQDRFGSYAKLSAPDVLDAARRLFTLGLLTNGGSRNQRNKIGALQLDRWIPADHIVVSGEIDAWKPDAKAFEAVLRACGADAARSVYVGDDPNHDIGGAQAVGMRTCWVARGRAFPDTPAPDWTIDSIADLADVWDEFPT